MVGNELMVSVIIPTLNRAHLIGDTLDSIISQTYTNWECIVVDDGSIDKTSELMTKYCAKDTRIQYHHRPSDCLPGGNAARNYGFELSKGDLIQWFDSDDLMVPDKLEREVNAIVSSNADFCVSKTKYFNHPNNSFFNYDFYASDVNFESYAVDYIRWHTPDLMVKRDVVADIRFNERMTAGQEHNFNCKLLLKTNRLFYLDSFLTLRRYNENSIQGNRDKHKFIHHQKIFETHWYNYKELKEEANSERFNRFSLLQCTLSYLELKCKISLPPGFHKELRNTFPNRFYFFYLAKTSLKLFDRYYKFYAQLKNGEEFNTFKKNS